MLAIQTARDMDEVRRLFLEYQGTIGEELCFQGFAEELAALPASYTCILLAVEGDRVLGCVALRPHGEGVAEMKRLYVRPAGRGRGIGRLLVSRVIDEARRAGYRRIVLETLPQMKQAQTLYRSLGFRKIAPYYLNLIPGASYLELTLLASGSTGSPRPG